MSTPLLTLLVTVATLCWVWLVHWLCVRKGLGMIPAHMQEQVDAQDSTYAVAPELIYAQDIIDSAAKYELFRTALLSALRTSRMASLTRPSMVRWPLLLTAS